MGGEEAQAQSEGGERRRERALEERREGEARRRRVRPGEARAARVAGAVATGGCRPGRYAPNRRPVISVPINSVSCARPALCDAFLNSICTPRARHLAALGPPRTAGRPSAARCLRARPLHGQQRAVLAAARGQHVRASRDWERAPIGIANQGHQPAAFDQWAAAACLGRRRGTGACPSPPPSSRRRQTGHASTATGTHGRLPPACVRWRARSPASARL